MIELRRRHSAESAPSGRLPNGYQEVEYLESTGRQKLYLPAFDTNMDFSIEMSVSITEYSVWTPLLIAPSNLNIWIGSYNDDFVLRSYAGANIITLKKPDTNKFFSVKIRRVNDILYLYIDGSLIGSASHWFNVTSDVFVYFADGINNTNIIYSKFKSRELKYDNYHLIPCYRTSDRKPGMYDIVNDVFYVNQGIGEFLVGADVGAPKLPSEYQEVEYLEDTGSQYIELPIYRGFNGSITTKIKAVNRSQAGYRIALGWNSGAQIGITNQVGSLFRWHNYNTSQVDFEFDRLYEAKLVIKGLTSELYVDDVLVVSNSTFNNTLALTLFRAHTQVTAFYGRIYELNIEGTQNMHLIPCYRKSDNKTGLYDMIGGVFYDNLSLTAEFYMGPEII